MTLLQRLASVGLGRRDEQRGARAEPRAAAPNGRNCRRCRSASRSADAATRCRNTPDGRPRRPRRASISTAGRPPVHKPVDDDQLDIPAFLRRQAN